MKKKCKIHASIPITCFQVPIIGFTELNLTPEEIYKCLCAKGEITEILPNGKLVDLDFSNYDKDNSIVKKEYVKPEITVNKASEIKEELKESVDEVSEENIVEEVEVKEEIQEEETTEEKLEEVSNGDLTKTHELPARNNNNNRNNYNKNNNYKKGKNNRR